MLTYYDFFKEHKRWDYNSFIFDVNDIFQDFTVNFPIILLRKTKKPKNIQEIKEKDDKLMLGLISTLYKDRKSISFYEKKSEQHSFQLNSSFSLDKTKNLKNCISNKSNIIYLKSRKITLDEAQIEKILNSNKVNEKKNCFRMIPTEFSENNSKIFGNNENDNDNQLFENLFRSKTIFHKKIYNDEKNVSLIRKISIFPKISNIKAENISNSVKNLGKPIKAEYFRYIKQKPDIKSFKNLQFFAKDYLKRFIV